VCEATADLGGHRVPERLVGQRRFSALCRHDGGELGRAVRQEHGFASRLEQFGRAGQVGEGGRQVTVDGREQAGGK